MNLPVVNWEQPGLLARVVWKWRSGEYTAVEIAKTTPFATRGAIIGKMARMKIIQGTPVNEQDAMPVLKLPEPVKVPKFGTIDRYKQVKRCKCGSAHLQPGRNQCATCITVAYRKIHEIGEQN